MKSIAGTFCFIEKGQVSVGYRVLLSVVLNYISIHFEMHINSENKIHSDSECHIVALKTGEILYRIREKISILLHFFF